MIGLKTKDQYLWIGCVLALAFNAAEGYTLEECRSLNKNATENQNKPFGCLQFWLKEHDNAVVLIVIASFMIFLATFLPKIMVRLLISSLSKIKFIRLIMTDAAAYCVSSSANLVSASLIWGSLFVVKLHVYLLGGPLYVWGIFFLLWIDSIFKVIQSFAVRRWGGLSGESSKRVVITESVKLFRIIVLLIIATIIYLPIFGTARDVILYSVFGMVGLSMALGSVATAHNSLGGLYLVFHAPFKVDDFIEIGDVKGTVQRVALRYTVLTTLDGTTTFVPNNFFLRKPMINFSQRPKRQLEIFVEISSDTPAEKIRLLLKEIESVLETLHAGLTSHRANLVDIQTANSSKRFFFVTMDELYKIRVYSYTEELDPKKHALIKSEVWLAIAEVMEELKVEERASKTEIERQTLIEDESPMATEFGIFGSARD